MITSGQEWSLRWTAGHASRHYVVVPRPDQVTPAWNDAAWAKLGVWLRSVRSRRGFTQSRVAQLAGMSESRYRQIETGRTTAGKPLGRPSPDALLHLEAALAVPRGSCRLVLDGADPEVDLAALPPIELREDTAPGGQRVIYAGPVDPDLLQQAADQLAALYRQAG